MTAVRVGDEVTYQPLDPQATAISVIVKHEKGMLRLRDGELINRGQILEVRHKEEP